MRKIIEKFLRYLLNIFRDKTLDVEIKSGRMKRLEIVENKLYKEGYNNAFLKQAKNIAKEIDKVIINQIAEDIFKRLERGK